MQIAIDISDWEKEANREGVSYKDEQEMLEDHVRNTRAPTQTGRLAVAARQLGYAAQDILPENKLLLMNGAALAVSEAFRRKSHCTEIGGKPYQVRDWVGSLSEGEVSETYLPSDSIEAANRAEDYLLRIIPCHVLSRLVILAEQGMSLSDIAEQLKAKIDEMVDELESVSVPS